MIYLKIFFGKMIDVTLNTLVTIYVVKNKRLLATIIGFFDMFIWLLVVSVALNDTGNSIGVALIYSLGFSAGTYAGTFISNKFNNEDINIQIITQDKNNCISNIIKNKKYPASIVECKEINDNTYKYIIYTKINNKELEDFKNLLKEQDKLISILY